MFLQPATLSITTDSLICRHMQWELAIVNASVIATLVEFIKQTGALSFSRQCSGAYSSATTSPRSCSLCGVTMQNANDLARQFPSNTHFPLGYASGASTFNHLFRQ